MCSSDPFSPFPSALPRALFPSPRSRSTCILLRHAPARRPLCRQEQNHHHDRVRPEPHVLLSTFSSAAHPPRQVCSPYAKRDHIPDPDHARRPRMRVDLLPLPTGVHHQRAQPDLHRLDSRMSDHHRRERGRRGREAQKRVGAGGEGASPCEGEEGEGEGGGAGEDEGAAAAVGGTVGVGEEAEGGLEEGAEEGGGRPGEGEEGWWGVEGEEVRLEEALVSV